MKTKILWIHFFAFKPNWNPSPTIWTQNSCYVIEKFHIFGASKNLIFKTSIKLIQCCGHIKPFICILVTCYLLLIINSEYQMKIIQIKITRKWTLFTLFWFMYSNSYHRIIGNTIRCIRYVGKRFWAYKRTIFLPTPWLYC